jgi:FMN phosphatase YigB (HAD superfamily)
MMKMIHDLDEMLYPTYPDAVNIMCNTAAISAVQDCGLRESVAAARALIDRAIAEKPDWMDYLVERGVDADQLHAAYHRRLDHKLITPYPSLSKYFAELGAQASHVMLTHSADEWAKRTLDHLSLRPWFPDERILAWEKYKALKGQSTKGFEMAANILQAEPRDIVFSDDSLRNLKTAKDMGMTTVWTSHGRPLPAEQAHYVDHVVGNIEIFMQQQIALMRKGMKP